MVPVNTRALAFVALALASIAALAALAAPALALEVEAPEAPGVPQVQAEAQVPSAPLPAAPAGLAPPSLIEGVATRANDLQLRDGTAAMELLAPPSQQRAASAGPAPSGRAANEGAPAAEMVAAGTLGALATLAMKFEPARRGLFLLGLPLYSRLRRSELLENGVRERIYRAIETAPGVSIIQVCRASKAGWGTAVYHLQRLERDRMIVSRRDGQYRRFYLNGTAPIPGAPDPAAKALQHPLAARIAAFVAANPGVAQKDVCVAMGIAPPLASKWLGRLLEAGLLTSQREWKLVRYAPTSALAHALAPPSAPAPVAAPPALPA